MCFRYMWMDGDAAFIDQSKDLRFIIAQASDLNS